MKPQVESALTTLIGKVPPPPPKNADSRHQTYLEAVRVHGEKNCGVYHFARWVATGQRGVQKPVLSSDTCSTATRQEVVREFLISVAPLIQSVSMLFHAVDPEMHQEYVDAYSECLHTSALTTLTTTGRACFQGLVLVKNLAAEPHKDTSDYKRGWVGMTWSGSYTGGELVVPILGIKISCQPGDVVFFRSTELEHYVLPFVGDRSAFVFFSHQDVMGAFV